MLNSSINESICLLYTLGNMADTYIADGEPDTARALTMAVLPRIEWSGMARRAADCHYRLACIARARNEMQLALNESTVAGDWYKRGEDPRGVAKCNALRATVSG